MDKIGRRILQHDGRIANPGRAARIGLPAFVEVRLSLPGVKGTRTYAVMEAVTSDGPPSPMRRRAASPAAAAH